MIYQLTQILAAGGLLVKMAKILALRVLCAPFLGLIAVIFVALALFLLTVEKEYRKNLFMSESDKRKLLDGNGL